MKAHKKAHAWLKDIFHILKSNINIYSEPPEHYLGFTVEGKVPVVLLPGIGGTWSYLKNLGDKISHQGHPVYVVPELGKNLLSIPKSARILHSLLLQLIPKKITPELIHKHAQIVSQFIEHHGLKAAVIVAHSKGGLIGKYLLAHFNQDHKVLGVIAVASPFSGSAIAKVIPHKAYHELHSGSGVVADLVKHSEVNKFIISIYPSYDPAVWAQKGSFLEGALANIEVPVTGHNTILDYSQVQEEVLKALDRITHL